MKHLISIFLVLTSVTLPVVIHAQGIPFLNINQINSNQNLNYGTAQQSFCNGPTCTYRPLEPLPGVTNAYGEAVDLPNFLSGLYKLLISLGALFAVAMLTLSGIRYMLAETSITDLEKAKTRIRASLWGLALLIGSWLILYTINPELLTFKLNLGQPATNTQTPPTQTGGSGTVQVRSLTSGSTAVYDNPNAYAEVITLQEACRGSGSGKTLHSTNTGTDERGSYTVWTCQ